MKLSLENTVIYLFFHLGMVILSSSQETQSTSAQTTKYNYYEKKMYEAHVSSNPNLGLLYADSALNEAYEQGNHQKVAHVKYYQSKLYRLNNQIDRSVKTILSIDPNYDRDYINNQLGEIFLDLGAYRQAIPRLKSFVESEKNLESKYYIYNLIGRAYLKLYDFENAKNIFLEQCEIAKSLNSDYFLIGNKINQMYLSLENNEIDKAGDYGVQAMDIYNASNPSNEIDQSSINLFFFLGSYHFKKKNYAQAIDLLTRSIYKLEQLQKNDVSQPQLLSIANILNKSYLATQKINESQELILQLSKNKLTKADMASLLGMKIDLAIARKNISTIATLKQEKDDLDVQLAKISVEEENRRQNILGEIYMSNAENELKYDKLKLAKAKSDQLFTVITAILSIAVIVIISVSIFLYSNNQKNKINLELNHKRNDLQNFSMDLTYRIKEKHEFLKELQTISHLHSDQIKQELKKLIAKLNAVDTSRKGLEKFLENVDQVNEAFTNKLLNKHPTLNKYEQEFCAFIKIGLSNKDISNIKNIETNSVRTGRARLKKKLNIGDQDLYYYLKSL